jgi:RNA polymerase sigma factor for flagellar operon FliA
VIERAIRFTARRYRLDFSDQEEFAATVMLRLVENEYAILRAYEERSSFATYISIVVQRMALDYRIHAWGKWHASAEARRLGPMAIELEQLLHRDGRALEEALAVVAAHHEGATPDALQELAERLPARAARHRVVGLDEAGADVASSRSDADEPLLASDRRNASERLSAIMSAAIARLPDDDRLILQLRFEGGMTVAQIARSLGLDQKLTYRRIERNMREMKKELERSGVALRDVLDLIGRDEVLVRFDLGKRKSRPSIDGDETAMANREESQ